MWDVHLKAVNHNQQAKNVIIVPYFEGVCVFWEPHCGNTSVTGGRSS